MLRGLKTNDGSREARFKIENTFQICWNSNISSIASAFKSKRVNKLNIKEIKVIKTDIHLFRKIYHHMF